MQIIIAVKNFRSCGNMYYAGQLITDPASIKRFKSKVSEGKIVIFDRHSSTTVSRIKFLESKLGVSILKEIKAYLASVDAKEDVKESVEE